MHRRAYLRGAATLGVAGAAGCLGGGSGDADPNVVLAEPDRRFESSDVPYPAWGERIPDVRVPAPLDDRTVTLRAVEGPRLLTFFYSSCPSVCPVLVSTLRAVQTRALERGYGDAVGFYPVTFDPARDDAARLRQYAAEMNVAHDAGNWHFLRPRSVQRAKQVVQEAFGVTFQRRTATENATTTATPGDGHHGTDGRTGTATPHGPGETDHTATAGSHDHTATAGGHDHTATAGGGGSAGGHDHGAYEFVHTSLTLLVNGDDYVERAYRTTDPDAARIVADLETVRTA